MFLKCDVKPTPPGCCTIFFLLQNSGPRNVSTVAFHSVHSRVYWLPYCVWDIMLGGLHHVVTHHVGYKVTCGHFDQRAYSLTLSLSTLLFLLANTWRMTFLFLTCSPWAHSGLLQMQHKWEWHCSRDNLLESMLMCLKKKAGLLQTSGLLHLVIHLQQTVEWGLLMETLC